MTYTEAQMQKAISFTADVVRRAGLLVKGNWTHTAMAYSRVIEVLIEGDKEETDALAADLQRCFATKYSGVTVIIPEPASYLLDEEHYTNPGAVFLRFRF